MSQISFKATRISTAGANLLTPVHIAGARIVSSTTADVTVHLHDAASTASTSASTRIATLFATNPGVDEVGYPLRCISGSLVVVAPSPTLAQVYIFVR